MRSGKMRHRITIQEPTTMVGSMGGVEQSWAGKCTVWASVEPLEGREYYRAGQMQNAVTTRFRVRYMAGETDDITEEMRVSFDGGSYDINSVQDRNERHAEILLMCTKRSEGA